MVGAGATDIGKAILANSESPAVDFIMDAFSNFASGVYVG